MKGGIGSASKQLADDIVIGAVVVVNAYCEIVDPQNQQIIAGTRSHIESGFLFTDSGLLGNTTIAEKAGVSEKKT
jgi:L-aminopeptidase/D-esterase-like protein